MPVLDALTELFTWIGLGGGIVVGGIALVLLMLDGVWLPVTGYIEDGPEGPSIHWLDVDGVVHAVPIDPEARRGFGDRDHLQIYARRGASNRMRMHRVSGGVRAATLIAVILGGVGVLAVIGSMLLLLMR